MKRSIVFVILIMIFLILNSTSYAQTFANQGIIPSYNPWNFFTQGDYLTKYTQNLYSHQNPESFLRSYDLNINPLSGWLNHPPVSTYSPTSPMVMKAGESSIFNYWVIDPDSDQLYSSSNFGSTTQYIDGTFGWSFSPSFPGQYLMEAVVYDERGGFSVMRSPVYVKPWWSF